MTTNNLLSDRCTICKYDPTYERIRARDPRVCRCDDIPNTRGEKCAMALYAATMKRLADTGALVISVGTNNVWSQMP